MSSTLPTLAPRRAFLSDLVSAFLLAILQVVLYRKVVRLWWTYDDPNNLRTITEHPFLAPFTDGAVWPQQLFTPLMIVVFDIEHALFGLEPSRWYAAQLAILIVTTVAVYAALRSFVAVGPALAAAATFAAGAPLCAIVTQLSTVHYFVAIAFSALATMVFAHALRRSSWVLAALSALLYLVALLGKEVAISLPLLLVALPVRDLRTRARFVAVHAIAIVVYFSWRYAVLGTFLGAYSWVIELSDWPGLLLQFPWRVIRTMAGPHLATGMVLMAAIAVVLLAGVRGRREWMLVLVGAIVVVGPILPVAKEVNLRYMVVPWLGVAVAFAIAASSIRDRRARVAALVLVPLLTIAANRQEWSDEFRVRQRMSDEARFWFAMPDGVLLRKPSPPSATMRELSWLKAIHLRGSAASWFYDDYFLCANDLGAKRVWEYDATRRTMVEITPRIPEMTRRHCGAIRTDVPLTASFHFRDSALHWDLGPYEHGQYAAIVANGWEAFPIPKSDGLHLPGMNALTLRIRYDSPEGWTTYSPDLTLDFVNQPRYTWKR